MIVKLYKQMLEIRVHAEKNCHKNLRPQSDFSPAIQMWYERIHAYFQLIRLREGKVSNAGNIVRFTKRKHIKWPEELTMEELNNRLQFCRIQKAELRKQAKGLRKIHLQDCLLDMQAKRQNKQAKVIKQMLHREESKLMWYLMKRMVKDPHSPCWKKRYQLISKSS